MDLTTLGIILTIIGIVVAVILGLRKTLGISQSQKNTKNSNQNVNVSGKEKTSK